MNSNHARKTCHGLVHNVVISRHRYTTTFDLFLPPFLTPDVWYRHNYTVEDVRKTLAHFSSSKVWQSALVHSILPNPSCMHVSFASNDTVTFSNKFSVIRKIVRNVREDLCKNRTSVLVDSCDHIPKLPSHSCDALYRELHKHLPSTRPLLYPSNVLEYEMVHSFKDILLVPISLDDDLGILVHRVVLESWYVKNMNMKNCAQPVVVLDLGSSSRYVLVDECFFITR